MNNLLPLDDGNSTELQGSYNVPPVLTDTLRLEPRQQQQRRQDGRTVAKTVVDGLAKSAVSREDHEDEVASRHSVGNETRLRRTKKLPQAASSSVVFTETAGHDARRRSLVCSRRRLIVDAVDIGWNEHVVFPRQFQADYCAGTCPFPRPKVPVL